MQKLTAACLAVIMLTASAHGAATETRRARVRSNVPDDPVSWVYYTEIDKADLENDPGTQVAAQEVEALLSIPVLEKNNYLVAVGASLIWNRIEFSGMDTTEEDLYAIGVPIDLIIGAASPLVVWLNFTPGLFSDLDDVDADDYRTQANAIALYQYSEQLSFAAGFSYDTVFGEDELYPLAGVVWKIRSEWEIALVLPQTRVAWAPNDRLLIFGDIRPAGGVWNVHSEDDTIEYDFKVETWRAGIGCEVGLTDHLWLHAAVGADVEREYEVRMDDTTIEKATADDAVFARAGILLR